MIRKVIGVASLAAGIIAPLAASAQGVAGGVERGSREGERAAGPVGAIVGGAIEGVVGGVAAILGADDRAIRKYALSTAVTMSGTSDLSLRVAGSNSTSAAKLRFALASRSDGAALSECAWLPRVQRTEPAYRSLPQGLTIVAW